MGVADFGLSAGPGGTIVPSIVNTTSVRGTIDTTATGIHGLDLADSSPDGYDIQLNAVQTNVTLFGQGGYSFWTQDIALYYPDADQLYLDSNIWNFSSPIGNLTSNVFYSHGPFGVQVGNEFYYAFIGPFTVTYPFQLTFYLNSTLVHGRDAVFFTADISSPSGTYREPWDFAVFNSTAPVGARLPAPSNYSANGFLYNPVGLTDDFEMILGGPNGGSQADLAIADATIGLAYKSGGHYVDVPSAYGYGGETGETVIGASVGWSNAPGGPDHLPAYGVVSTGPAILTGLWNAGGAEGVVPVHLELQPSNAFLFLTAAPSPYVYAEPEYAPTIFTDTLFLAPGTYTYLLELSNHAPSRGTLVVPAHGSSRLSGTLRVDYAYGIYTPLFAWQNSQLPAISYYGSGTPTSPYRLVNDQYAPIGPLFGVLNDYGYPVFAGVLLVDTTASVSIVRPASFLTEFQGEFISSPFENNLPFWFQDVRHVALVGGTNVTGWFDFNVYAPTYWTPYDVVFYNSDDNLVASNAFNVDGGGALLLFGGGHNTVWGNTLHEVPAPASGLGYAIPYAWGIGIVVAESGDTLYNNYVATPTTAWQTIFNLYNDTTELWSNRWNITVQSASHVHYAAGFPLYPLVGSILGTSWQGGNYWWDYGTYNEFNGANNPFGQIPYTENATTPWGNSPYIVPGGDYAPLNYVGPP